MRCPKCKSRNVRPILWGMPTYEAFTSGKYYIGGCCEQTNEKGFLYDYGCLDCDFKWCLEDFEASDIEKILIITEPTYSNILTRELRYCRVYSDGRILAYSTIGRSRKRQRKRRGKMSVEKFQKLAEYLLEIIVYKKPPEYEDEVYDGSLLTVRIQFPDKRIGEYIHDLQGTAVWDHIEEAFVGSRIRVLHN